MIQFLVTLLMFVVPAVFIGAVMESGWEERGWQGKFTVIACAVVGTLLWQVLWDAAGRIG